MNRTKQYLNNLVNKIITETLQDKADEVMEKIEMGKLKNAPSDGCSFLDSRIFNTPFYGMGYEQERRKIDSTGLLVPANFLAGWLRLGDWRDGWAKAVASTRGFTISFK